jgi:hypothetical protein
MQVLESKNKNKNKNKNSYSRSDVLGLRFLTTATNFRKHARRAKKKKNYMPTYSYSPKGVLGVRFFYYCHVFDTHPDVCVCVRV